MFDFVSSVLDPNLLLNNACDRSPWFDLAFWAISGGAISGLLQLMSERLGNKQLRIAYKKLIEENKELRKKLDILFDRKEMYKDAVEIIQSKVEMYSRLMYNPDLKEQGQDVCNSCFHLTDEITDVIKKVKPNPGEKDTTFRIEQKNN